MKTKRDQIQRAGSRYLGTNDNGDEHQSSCNVLVTTDLFRMYTTAVPLALTSSADVAREIV